MFLDDRQGFVGGVECALFGLCLDDWPATNGDFVVPSTNSFEPIGSTVFDMGSSVEFAGITAAYNFTPASHYAATSAAAPPADADVNLVLTGSPWGDYTGTADAHTPSILQPLTPVPGTGLTVISDEVLTFTWTPGTGDLYFALYDITISGELLRLYKLDDSGTWDLDLANAGLPAGATNLVFQLFRQTTDDFDVNGNSVEVVSRSMQRWYTDVISVAGRTLIDPVEVPADVAASPVIAPGLYYGRVEGTLDNINPTPGPGCLDQAVPGFEGQIKFEVPDGELLSVTYDLPTGSSAIYFLTDPTDDTTCMGGTVGDVANWYNDTGSSVTVYAVLDATDATGLFLLDVDIKPVSFVATTDLCADAAALSITPPGSYFGALTGNTDALTSDLFGGCTGYPTEGEDGFMKVTVPDGKLFRADYNLIEGDASIYLVTDCADFATCISGKDDIGGPTEVLEYYNDTGADIEAYLVLDAYNTFGGTSDFWLDIEVLDVNFLTASDDCAGASSLANLTTGTYLGDLSTFTDQLDPGSAGCTGYEASGGEGFVPFELADGETIHLVYDSASDGSLYIVSDCTDASTCLIGVDEFGFPEEITYTNSTGSTQNYFVALDGWLSTSTFNLEVEIY